MWVDIPIKPAYITGPKAVYYPVTSILQFFYLEIFLLGAERQIVCVGMALQMAPTKKLMPSWEQSAFCLSLHLLLEVIAQ